MRLARIFASRIRRSGKRVIGVGEGILPAFQRRANESIGEFRIPSGRSFERVEAIFGDVQAAFIERLRRTLLAPPPKGCGDCNYKLRRMWSDSQNART